MPVAHLLGGVAGFLLIVSVPALLFRRVVVLTSEGKESSFKFPVIGEFKTQNPVLGMLAIGAILIAYSIYALPTPPVEMATLVGTVKTTQEVPVEIVIVAVPHYSVQSALGGNYEQPIPIFPPNAAQYKAKILVNNRVFAEEVVRRNGSRLEVPMVNIRLPEPEGGLIFQTKRESGK